MLNVATIVSLIIAVVPTIVAITLHEAAHGYAAWALGDDTAKRAGRLSLNPLVHVDRVGTILLPGALLLGQLLTIGRVAFMFGWAKPVPVASWRFRNPRRGMMIVAAAGPAMNLLLAYIGALAAHILPFVPAVAQNDVGDLIYYFILSNVALGLFNLIPIPPLDGGRIAVGLLPEPLALRWAKLERGGLIIVLVVIYLLPGFLNDIAHVKFDPVGNLYSGAIRPVIGGLLRAAGNGMPSDDDEDEGHGPGG